MQETDSRFDENGQLIDSQWIFVYGFDYMNVFTSGYNAYLEKGMALPPGTTLVTPPATQSGFAAVFDPVKNDWYVTADHRGETVYHKRGQQRTTVDYLGDYRDDVTPLAPNSSYDHWDDASGSWVADAERSAEEIKAKQIRFMTDERDRSDDMVTICNDKIELEYFLGDETAESVGDQLMLWRKYHLQCAYFLNGMLTVMPYAPDSAEYIQQQAENQAQAQAEEQAQRQAEIEKQQEAEAQADADAKAKAQAQAQADADAKAKAQAQADADAKEKAQAQADADAKEKAQAQADADAKAKAQAQADADAKAQTDAANAAPQAK
ncbi:hypothetical protein [Rosenbergiella collisarenosi]|uniref:hypothetical protein n=1 Tax=Rosenbergiella collisarenosi TaxID=1544695 RepID=UPI001F4E1855|nr:hypothetical protein [Rosenbergiella collisarenosi]